MGTPEEKRSSRKASRHSSSQFYRDLASPLKIDLSTQPQNSCSSSSLSPLWRHGFGGPDPPPPPILSLDERERLESPTDHLPTAPPTAGDDDFKTPAKAASSSTAFSPVISFSSSFPHDAAQGDARPSYSGTRLSFDTPGDSNRRPLLLLNGEESRALATAPPQQQHEGASGGFLALPPPTDTARPDSLANETADGQGWVTVYGFTPQNTNLVLRVFEKCGTILKHAPGPEGANWMHILYQNPYDVQKALQKNGMQISGALMVGVKPVDPLQCQAFTEKAKTGFMVLPPRSPGKVSASTSTTKAFRPYYLQQLNEGGPIASPSKSTVSRIVDLIFGM
uniref:Nuclear pore complex protein NUP35 n=1 Tax=Araucaria cunninghamii TaxID=56994 RepID=A0A0D6R8F2_ARACU